MQKNQILTDNIKISKIYLSDFDDIFLIEKDLNMELTSHKFFKNFIKSKNIRNYKLTFHSIVVGFIFYQFNFEICDIISICIKKNFQKLGLGTKLINFVKTNNFKNIYVEVSVENKGAIEFYKKIGFFFVGRRKKYYKKNGDALLMKLSL